MNPLITTGLGPGATALSVNLNKVALLRNQRDIGIPSVVRAATIVLEAGARGITVHPRPDERHVRRHDVHELAALLKRSWPQAEFNIEGNPFHNLMDFVRAVKPHQCTFVPDSTDQATSDHGWNFVADAAFLNPIVKRLKKGGFRVSLFSDSDPAGISAARDTGADRIELYTGPYGSCHSDSAKAAKELERLGKTADAALVTGFQVNAGHDLTVQNLPALARRIPALAEVSIGHGLTADALEYGMAGTVGRFLKACGW